MWDLHNEWKCTVSKIYRIILLAINQKWNSSLYTQYINSVTYVIEVDFWHLLRQRSDKLSVFSLPVKSCPRLHNGFHSVPCFHQWHDGCHLKLNYCLCRLHYQSSKLLQLLNRPKGNYICQENLTTTYPPSSLIIAVNLPMSGTDEADRKSVIILLVHIWLGCVSSSRSYRVTYCLSHSIRNLRPCISLNCGKDIKVLWKILLWGKKFREQPVKCCNPTLALL